MKSYIFLRGKNIHYGEVYFVHNLTYQINDILKTILNKIIGQI